MGHEQERQLALEIYENGVLLTTPIWPIRRSQPVAEFGQKKLPLPTVSPLACESTPIQHVGNEILAALLLASVGSVETQQTLAASLGLFALRAEAETQDTSQTRFSGQAIEYNEFIKIIQRCIPDRPCVKGFLNQFLDMHNLLCVLFGRPEHTKKKSIVMFSWPVPAFGAWRGKVELVCNNTTQYLLMTWTKSGGFQPTRRSLHSRRKPRAQQPVGRSERRTDKLAKVNSLALKADSHFSQPSFDLAEYESTVGAPGLIQVGFDEVDQPSSQGCAASNSPASAPQADAVVHDLEIDAVPERWLPDVMPRTRVGEESLTLEEVKALFTLGVAVRSHPR